MDSNFECAVCAPNVIQPDPPQDYNLSAWFYYTANIKNDHLSDITDMVNNLSCTQDILYYIYCIVGY